MATLFVVATPIGNLDDLSLRAAKVLASVHVIYAEDTRRTGKLVAHLGLQGKPVRRLDANATAADFDAALELLTRGEDVAVCTDAGTPCVSDPGSELVRRARESQITIVPVPGPSAVTTALSASGYAFGSFRFMGFLPRTGLDRTRVLAEITSARDAVVLFESPQRTAATLAELARAMPDRRVTVARELTKLHEQLVEGVLPEIAQRMSEREILGEVTLVLSPYEAGSTHAPTDAEIDARIDAALGSGMRSKEVSERVALETGRSKGEIYDRVLKRRGR